MKHLREICCVGLLFLFSGGTMALAGEASRTPQTRDNIALPATGVKQPAKSKHLDEIIFYEDWEGGLNGWVSRDLTDTPGSWHIDTWFAFGGTGMSWCMGQHPVDCDTVGYLNDWYMVLDSPPIVLPAGTCSLTFWHRVACEIPGGEPPPYNGWDGCNIRISTNDGASWTVIANEYIQPDYDRSSLYSFGFQHGEGPGIPGWVGNTHMNWFFQTANLTPWAGQTAELRWAFASDPAWCTCDFTGNRWAFGWQVDNVRVFSGADTVFANNGDNDTGWYSHSNLPVVGDLWRVADECNPPPCPPPSGSHYLACNDSVTLSYTNNMNDEIVSPYIDLRGLELGTLHADFLVSGYIGSPCNNFPEDCDYWHWEVSPDSGATWYFSSNPCDQGGYNYVHIDAPTEWMLYSEAYNLSFDMSCYIGSVVQIRAVFETDEELTGVGPCFDDFTLTYHPGYENDMSCYTLHVPFPTTQGRSVPGKAYFINAGWVSQSGVSAWWREAGGYNHRLMPNLALAPGQTAMRSFTWTPTSPGATMVLAWTAFYEDENSDNDTSYCPNIEVRGPAEDLELGYDNRIIQYQFNYETGNGVLVRFAPDESGIQQPFNLKTIRMQFDDNQVGPQQIGLHIFRDEGGMPGGEVFEEIITVTPPGEVYPNWKEAFLDGPVGGVCISGDFWVWLEVVNTEPEYRYPQILGADAEPWENYEHFYTYHIGEMPEPQPFFYMVRALLTEGVECPDIGYITSISPGPPDWGYRLHWVSGSLSRLVFADFCEGTVGSVSGNAQMVGWTVTDCGDSIVFTNLFDPLIFGSIDIFWLSHPTCSDYVTWTAGDSSGTIEGPLPVELTTFEAFAGDGQVTLRWRTESELDNDHFVLYKRKTGEEDFRILAEIPGHGTTTQPHDYDYVDRFVRNGLTYEYRISDVDISGRETIHEQIVSATPNATVIPTEFALHAPYPNPFNPTTTIRYDVKEAGLVSLKIFDLLGREVATLVHGTIPAGSYSIDWNAGDLPSGIYLCRMEAQDFTQMRKVVLLK